MIVPPSPHALRLVRSALGWQPGHAKFEPVSAGRHLRVFKVLCPPAEPVALKEYAPDFRASQSLQREFAALLLLSRHGIEGVPKALHQDSDHGVAIYDWMEGSAISPTDRGEDVFDPFVGFLSSLARIPLAEHPQWAPRAVRSGSALEERLRLRLETLPGDHQLLGPWLTEVCEPTFQEMLKASREACQPHFAWDGELSPQHRILAPFHLGFDDVLETVSRQIVFLNFSGFGQDDPAGTLARILVQSLETATPDQKAGLIPKFFHQFGRDSLLGTRFAAWLPLVGLEMVLDHLEPFRPLDRPLRDFAGLPSHPKEETLVAALGRARRALDLLRAESIRD